MPDFVRTTHQLARYITDFVEPWRYGALTPTITQLGWVQELKNEAFTHHTGDITGTILALKLGVPPPATATAREIAIATTLLGRTDFKNEARPWVDDDDPGKAASLTSLKIVMYGIYLTDHPDLGGGSLDGGEMMMAGGDSLSSEGASEDALRELAIERGRARARALFPPRRKTRDELVTYAGLNGSGFLELVRAATRSLRAMERSARRGAGELARHGAGVAPKASLPTVRVSRERRRVEPAGLSEIRARRGRRGSEARRVA